jgi:hypothetical protein
MRLVAAVALIRLRRTSCCRTDTAAHQPEMICHSRQTDVKECRRNVKQLT